ncbi:unnamed protein product [Camellia sinensis]
MRKSEKERDMEGVKEREGEMITKHYLSMAATTRQWKDVLYICNERPDLQVNKLTKSGDTALHLAVSDGQIKVVQQLIQLLRNSGERQTKEVLRAKNAMGNTPLHLAAALGSVHVCKSFASIDDTLIRARNLEGETPLFVAVLNGNKDAFLYLHRLLNRTTDADYLRRMDGETILHAAINQEYFV